MTSGPAVIGTSVGTWSVPEEPRPVRRWVAPPDWLAPHVERIWSWTAPAGTTVPAVLPGVGAEAFWHVGTPFAVRELDGSGATLPQAHLLCLRGRSVSFVAAEPVAFVAVRFRVGALRRMTDVPVRELDDRFVPLTDVFGPGLATLPERVHDAAGDLADDAAFRRAVDVVLGALRPALAEAPTRTAADRALTRLYYGAGRESVVQAASAVGMSVRTMERVVTAAVGLGPKRVQRLARLHHVARRVFVEGVDPLAAALDRGFYDQSHVIAEARALTGRTPSALFAGVTHFYNPRLPARPHDGRGPDGPGRGQEVGRGGPGHDGGHGGA